MIFITSGPNCFTLNYKLFELKVYTVRPVLSNRSKDDKNGFQGRLSLNAGQKYCRMP